MFYGSQLLKNFTHMVGHLLGITLVLGFWLGLLMILNWVRLEGSLKWIRQFLNLFYGITILASLPVILNPHFNILAPFFN